MPEQEYNVLVKIILEDKKYKEVAEELHISINTVKTHLSRALKMLRRFNMIDILIINLIYNFLQIFVTRFAYLLYLILNSATIMQKSKTKTLIQKYLSHQLNEQEFEELKQWIEKDASHRDIFVKLLSLHHVNNQLNLLHQFDKEASWKAIQKCYRQSHSIHYRIVIYSSAAVIAVIIGITSILYFRHQESSSLITENNITKIDKYNIVPSPRATLVLADQSEIKLYSNHQEINGSHINNEEIIYPQENRKETDQPVLDTILLQNQLKVPRGSEYSIVLSDGTKVKLNADSHLDFPVQFTNIREVTLQGEAFFDVIHEPQRPFIVKANDHVVYVLGTTFNVTAYPGEDVSITLVSGKIKVTSPTGEYTMTPNEHYSSQTSLISK